MPERRDSLHVTLDTGATHGASTAPAAVDYHLDRFTELVATLQVVSAERDTGDETYDLYLITGDGLSEWDLVHFPQVATTGAKTFTARVSSGVGESVTTAAPGVVAIDTAILATVTGAANAPKSLAAGSVRHGPFGNMLRYELVVAGTIATGIVFKLQIQARR